MIGTKNYGRDILGEIYDHLHRYDRWFETAASPDGEDHVADRLGDGGGSFQIDAGNDDWGAWVQILGATDTPIEAGKTAFMLHTVMIVGSERAEENHFLQISYGATAAAGLAAGSYTESVFKPWSTSSESSPMVVSAEDISSGTKVWARVKVPGQDTGTVNFFFGLHEHDT